MISDSSSSSLKNNNINKKSSSKMIVFILLMLIQFLYIPRLGLPPKWNQTIIFVYPVFDNSNDDSNNNNNNGSNSNDKNNKNESILLPPPRYPHHRLPRLSSPSVATAVETMASDNDAEKKPINNITETKPMDFSSSTSTTTEDEDDDDDVWWKSTLETASTILNDIDRMSESIACGWFKCYYPSLSQPDFGYIIGQRRDPLRPAHVFAIHNLQKSYDLALRLEKEYNLHHFMASQPTPMNATKELAQGLNKGVISYYGKDYKYLYLFRETKPQKYKRDKLVVQVVKSAPQPNLLVHLRTIMDLGTILNFTKAQNFFGNSNITFADDFNTNLIRDWNATSLALASEPELFQDFQFMLDTSGHIWQMDLDRFYSNKEQTVLTTGTIEERLKMIEDIIINPILNNMQKR